MIVLIDTSTPTCRLTIIENGDVYDETWQAGRELALGLLSFIEKQLDERGKTFTDITGLGVFAGPGSFTGLRIGITVSNTLADSLSVPIIGETGEDWQARTIDRLLSGENQTIVTPQYGGEAHITTPRK